MRRYLTLIIIAITAMGCEIYGGSNRKTEELGQAIWEITRSDLHRINEILTYAIRYDHLQTIEDEAEHETYKLTYIGNPEIEVNGNIHTLTYNTSYNTTYHVRFEFLDNGWHVVRTGGKSYDVTITRSEDDSMEAHFASIRNTESAGYADLTGTMTLVDDKLDITYTGDIVMVDGSRDDTKPLTLTTEITQMLEYNNFKGITDGNMTITAHDELYDTTDVAYITILEYHRTVIIKCYDTELGYSYNSNI